MKKPKLITKILGNVIYALILTLLASPFIALGVGIGYLIWR